jgi:Fe-S-cluster containining protein
MTLGFVKKNVLLEKEGFPFGFDPNACQSCGGVCCTGDAGHVWLTEKDIVAISYALTLDVEEFVQDCLIKINHRFSLKELRIKGKLECVLLDSDTKRCTVYEVRPQQCKTYPFWDCFKKNAQAAFHECPGVRPLA